MNLKLSAWSAVIAAILVFPSVLIGILYSLFQSNSMYIIYTVMVLISTMFSLFIMLGYIEIAKLKKLKKLEILMWIYFGVTIIYSIMFTVISDSNLIYAISPLILMGIIAIIAGKEILKLKRYYGSIAKNIGILYIVNGILMVTIILFGLSIFTGFVTLILEAIFFFKVSK
ncbi:hypothetical protein HN385_05140 [archaeon]|jgi:hypothetical protein|nr:hypothetical protein [archaeon]MBT3451406.1 hypothetical protein [archaeon]MBT6869250.1 hypothetical protein [archaeon]MBT7193648.1 hypothetical protein [archaeon]MBT7380266.1 hypothetical protein [archaeon]